MWLLVKLPGVLSRVVSSAYMMGVNLLLTIARSLIIIYIKNRS